MSAIPSHRQLPNILRSLGAGGCVCHFATPAIKDPVASTFAKVVCACKRPEAGSLFMKSNRNRGRCRLAAGNAGGIVLVLSGNENPKPATDELPAGVDGFLLKQVSDKLDANSLPRKSILRWPGDGSNDYRAAVLFHHSFQSNLNLARKRVLRLSTPQRGLLLKRTCLRSSLENRR